MKKKKIYIQNENQIEFKMVAVASFLLYVFGQFLRKIIKGKMFWQKWTRAGHCRINHQGADCNKTFKNIAWTKNCFDKIDLKLFIEYFYLLPVFFSKVFSPVKSGFDPKNGSFFIKFSLQEKKI